MRTFRTFAALSTVAFATACATSDHVHPQASMASTAAMPMGMTGTPPASDPRMKAMQEMHQKMLSASTPADRQALMAEHLKALQGGMAMMKEMHAMHAGGGMGMMASPGSSAPMGGMAGMGAGKGMSPDMAKRHQMMADPMALMQMMVDMMAQRVAPASTAQ